MLKVLSREWLNVAVCSSLIAACASDPVELDENTTESAITAIGDALPNAPAGFDEAAAAFNTDEALPDGLGPIFNEIACGRCHTQGALGGAGTQIERRFGTTFRDNRGNVVFEPLANDGLGPFPARGGSLRQLMTVGSFTSLTGRSCTVPLEREPPEATIHNVGRLTTPLFGLGLVEALPDSTFDNIAASQPTAIRGIARRVTVLLPGKDNPTQRLNGTRVGRFGWKAGIASLTQFAADAYVNEMGITTQHCVKGASVLSFATEQQPSGIAQANDCDDLAPPQPAGNGVPTQTDDAIGSCTDATGAPVDEIQDDVAEFTEFMTFLAPPPRGAVNAQVNRGATLFSQTGCNGCHVTTTFRTPAAPGNGVPANFAFNPFSDFLVHDMGNGSDFIGDFGDSVAVTRRMRTAPLWGARFRTLFMHDGSQTSIAGAAAAHQGQGATAAGAFNRLSAAQKTDLVAFVNSL